MARATTHGLRKPASVTVMNPLENCFPKVLLQVGGSRWTACQVRMKYGRKMHSTNLVFFFL